MNRTRYERSASIRSRRPGQPSSIAYAQNRSRPRAARLPNVPASAAASASRAVTPA
ncbi:hypothetical protein [Alloactinosynnema sp. L-07]|uniref:hypothetical protein n=1 Tax=Alloactinosynnema sp. L-07 TaxID=1653480 RepID=UPI0012F85DD6|nr:hypothetical protein [Alloactinosynnema sp. L-07]